MKRKNGRKGFAMLEVLVMTMVFLVIAASLFASAAAVHRRAVERASKDEAYYAAVTAVRLMAGELMENSYRAGSAAAELMTAGGMDPVRTALSVTPDGGEVVEIPVTVSSVIGSGGRFITLTAEAEAGGQKEQVSMTLQNRVGRISSVPDYPYGCGLMGKFSVKSGAEIQAGADVDLFIKGFETEESVDMSQIIRKVGGNLVAEGTEVVLGEGCGVGGMIISDSGVTLNKVRVGNDENDGIGMDPLLRADRTGGIYTTGDLRMTDCDVYGDVYANGFFAGGTEYISGMLHYGALARESFTVWDAEGNHVQTSDAGYRRTGEVTALGGKKKILNPEKMETGIPGKKQIFVPETDGLTESSGMTIVRLSDGESCRLDGMAPNGTDLKAAATGKGDVPTLVILMEKGSECHIPAGTYSAYVYGEGEVYFGADRNQVEITLYGGVQAEQIFVAKETKVTALHGKPEQKRFQTPSSAVGFGTWFPLDYDRKTPSED